MISLNKTNFRNSKVRFFDQEKKRAKRQQQKSWAAKKIDEFLHSAVPLTLLQSISYVWKFPGKHVVTIGREFPWLLKSNRYR